VTVGGAPVLYENPFGNVPTCALGFVTTTLASAEACAPVIAVIVVAFATVTFVAATPSSVTVAPFAKSGTDDRYERSAGVRAERWRDGQRERRRTRRGYECCVQSSGRAGGVGRARAEVVLRIAHETGDAAAPDRHGAVAGPQSLRRRRTAVARRQPVVKLPGRCCPVRIRRPVQSRGSRRNSTRCSRQGRHWQT